MKQIPLPVIICLSIRIPLALLQPDEPKSHARPGCGECGKCQHEEDRR